MPSSRTVVFTEEVIYTAVEIYVVRLVPPVLKTIEIDP
jgi:hypothetical protein